jgi:hypothetical protein
MSDKNSPLLGDGMTWNEFWDVLLSIGREKKAAKTEGGGCVDEAELVRMREAPMEVLCDGSVEVEKGGTTEGHKKLKEIVSNPQEQSK